MGVPRGSEIEVSTLARLKALQLLVVSIPRFLRIVEQNNLLSVRRITDYHTVQNTRTAKGDNKDTHLTWRQYLCDAFFAVVLKGERPIVEEAGNALKNPVWGIWLGRKACIPTAPVYVGVYDSEEEALNVVLQGQPLSNFSHQREVESFADGTDTLSDQPLCYGGVNSSRAFAPRRIKLVEGKQ